mmetsp:Transcript_21851/g.47547  ORF Transcript_21851/g.47547 Transcript_21851/m.47547 type:complete len:247 (-) Transcript_21851:1313-2053(-)
MRGVLEHEIHLRAGGVLFAGVTGSPSHLFAIPVVVYIGALWPYRRRQVGRMGLEKDFLWARDRWQHILAPIVHEHCLANTLAEFCQVVLALFTGTGPQHPGNVGRIRIIPLLIIPTKPVAVAFAFVGAVAKRPGKLVVGIRSRSVKTIAGAPRKAFVLLAAKHGTGAGTEPIHDLGGSGFGPGHLCLVRGAIGVGDLEGSFPGDDFLVTGRLGIGHVGSIETIGLATAPLEMVGHKDFLPASTGPG